MLRVLLTLILAGLLTKPTLTSAQSRLVDFDRQAVFDEVNTHVRDHFYRKDFDQKAWEKTAEKVKLKAIGTETLDGFAFEVNTLLSELNASHTRYFSRNDPKRYQLLGVFHQLYDGSRVDLFQYDGIGIDTQKFDGKDYVISVIDGLTARIAGIQVGDVIEAVDGEAFHPVLSFTGKSGKRASIQIKRAGETKKIDVDVVTLDGRTMFETALKESTRQIDYEGKKIGYMHVWSYAGQKYQDEIQNQLLWGSLANCDGVILDLRDGWGGANLNYLNLFREPIAIVRADFRDGTAISNSGVWDKPVALLTNGRSTSGKELFTFGFKKLKLGTVIGEKTAGAVLGGRAFLLSNGDVLYLAVTQPVVDGEILEGVGVEPDIEVARDVTKGSKDPQLERAIEEVMKMK